jgi:hypothetical protein
VDGSAAGSTTLTLPAAATAGNGFLFYVFKSGTANNVIIDADGSETIDGQDAFTLSAQYSGLFLLCDGSGWGTFRDDRKPIRRESYGLVPSNGTDATNDIDFTAGACWDTTSANWIVVAALTKQADAPWAAGTNQGMIDTGSFAADKVYYFWAILHTDGTTDILMSLADTWTSVTKPTGYTTGQLIHALTTQGGSAAWTLVTVNESFVAYASNSQEISSYTSFVSNVSQTFTVNLPKSTECDGSLIISSTAGCSVMYGGLMDTSQTGLGVQRYAFYAADTTSRIGAAAGSQSVFVDENAQIAVGVGWNFGNETVSLYFFSYDFRRRFNGT